MLFSFLPNAFSFTQDREEHVPFSWKPHFYTAWPQSYGAEQCG